MWRRYGYLVMVLWLVSCRSQDVVVTPVILEETTPPATAAVATEVSETGGESDGGEVVVTGGAIEEVAPTATTVVSDVPIVLADLAWDDRSLFAGGLISGEREILEGLHGASVYHIEVMIGENLSQLMGSEAVQYTNREDVALDEIYFRLFPQLAAGSSEVSNVRVDGVVVEPELSLRGSAVRVPLAEALLPGDSVVVEMDFVVGVPTEQGGNYGEFIYDDDILALAHFYPMIAVYDDEGWNIEIAPTSGDVVYADTSFYVVQVQMPEELVLAASGVVIDEHLVGERRVTTYAMGPARDFYMIGSPQFIKLSATVGETTVNSYGFSEELEGVENVLQHALASMVHFEERFGPYAYTEFDLASSPTRALGIEYPGIIVNTNRIYVPQRYESLETTTVHEVGHQWFYGMIGNDQLDEPWLDEAMAQYATWAYFVDEYGEEMGQRAALSFQARWNSFGAQPVPIGMPVAEYEEAAYGAIVYGRGPIFVLTLQEVMGEEAFGNFMRDYYDQYLWGIATAEGYQALAETHCDCDLTTLFNDWVYRLD
ncbi:MAG TPA: M1 family metallopeptidase [Anaerolineae bacterium]|nr:M1 family metallopeptidase [Anaerolineae bacterium]